MDRGIYMFYYGEDINVTFEDMLREFLLRKRREENKDMDYAQAAEEINLLLNFPEMEIFCFDEYADIIFNEITCFIGPAVDKVLEGMRPLDEFSLEREKKSIMKKVLEEIIRNL